jgi:hypothetical protein
MNNSSQFIDYDKLIGTSDELEEQFRSAQPFSHLVLDNFLTPGFISKLNAAFPDIAAKKKMGAAHVPVILEDGTEAQLGKEWLSREQLVPLIYRRLYWELNANPFLGILEKITGIDNLIADPHMAGGGVHKTSPDGYLKVHADFNKHPNFGLDRRLNLLIYLNNDWLPEYGGDLELWAPDMSRCVQRIAPIAGRCVVFQTTTTSFHGHPHPLTCPADRSRKSIALYYYSNGRPEHEGSEQHETLWQETPQ